MECLHCEALEEALDILGIELQRERRLRRDLHRTIRLLKREITRNLNIEHELTVAEDYQT